MTLNIFLLLTTTLALLALQVLTVLLRFRAHHYQTQALEADSDAQRTTLLRQAGRYVRAALVLDAISLGLAAAIIVAAVAALTRILL